MPVRPAELSDAEAIGIIHVQCWREAYVGLMPEALLASLTVADRVKARQRFMSDPTRRIASFVATDTSDAIAGFADCAAQRDKELSDSGFTGEVMAIYVLRAAQRRGLGRALMAAAARELIARGHAGLALWVLRDNLPARRFYQALGGVEVGERLDERPNIQPGLVLNEVAYGWRDLRLLAGESA